MNCNGLFDYTSTTVRLPNVTVKDPDGDRNPKNPLVSAVVFRHLSDGSTYKILRSNIIYYVY